MAKLKGKFIVIPKQYGEDEAVKGVSFPNASKAQAYVDAVRKVMARTVASLSGIEKPGEDATDEEKKEYKKQCAALKSFIPMDVIIQPDGGGDAMEFESFEE